MLSRLQSEGNSRLFPKLNHPADFDIEARKLRASFHIDDKFSEEKVRDLSLGLLMYFL